MANNILKVIFELKPVWSMDFWGGSILWILTMKYNNEKTLYLFPSMREIKNGSR